MEFLTELWLPIVITAVVLFFASFVAWTILPHHRGDWSKLPDEDELMNTLRRLNIPPGNYMFPYCSHADMKNKEAMEKYKRGPRGTLNAWAMPNMAANMLCTVLFFLVTAAIMAYVSFEAMGRDQPFLKVFQIVGTIAILTYGSSGILHGIWFKRKLFLDIVDGIVYGLLTGLIFAFLWPRI
jgi:hypothetical protein